MSIIVKLFINFQDSRTGLDNIFSILTEAQTFINCKGENLTIQQTQFGCEMRYRINYYHYLLLFAVL